MFQIFLLSAGNLSGGLVEIIGVLTVVDTRILEMTIMTNTAVVHIIVLVERWVQLILIPVIIKVVVCDSESR